MRRLWFLLVLLCAVLCGPAPLHAQKGAKLSRESQQTLYNAQQAYKAGEFGKAVQILTPYMQSARQKEEAIPAAGHLMLGGSQHQLNQTDAAIASFTRGAEEHPQDPDLHLNLAIVLYEGNQMGKAADHFRKAYQLYQRAKKFKPELLYHAAISHYQDNKLRAAKKDMQTLWAANPKDVPTVWRIFWVQLLCALEDWPAAETAVLNYLAGHRQDASFWKLLGQVRASRGRYQGAASAFEVADSLQRLSTSELRMLADLYFYMDATMSGVRTLKRAAGNGLTLKDHDRLAYAYGRSLRTDDAIRHAQSALKAAPTEERRLALAQIMADGARNKELLALAKRDGNGPGNGELLLMGAMAALELEDYATMGTLLERASLDQEVAGQARAWLRMLEEMETAKREAQAAKLEAHGEGPAVDNATLAPDRTPATQ